MLEFKQDFHLKSHNTFGIDAKARYFVEIDSEQAFVELLNHTIYKTNKHLIIGGGSNILMMNDFDGLVIKNSIKGIFHSGTDGTVIVKAGAGEVWHNFVMFTIEQGWGGLENLSLIPGCVGASPMQNIGAYGVEIKDCFEVLEAIHVKTGERKIFSKEACKFGYRESVFKQAEKGNYFITQVSFRLNTLPNVNTAYGAIRDELVQMGVKQPKIKDVSEAVIRIRRSKLPDPNELGNAGSFFKNPEVSKADYDRLKASYEKLVAYPLENGNYKLAAGWLIENCELKGLENGGAAVHHKQALVLVNKNRASGAEVFRLSEMVIDKVFETYKVNLEREVNVVK
jgi:UDP-N-acetylmuramate dehydrogenase